MSSLSGLSVNELADEIRTWAGRVAAGEAHLLTLIAEFDRREGWAGPGLLSCAHWLSWQTGLSPNAARERVRVARRLEELATIAAAFGAGRMSWSQVRAVTRVATADDEANWVELAKHSSAAQLERVVRGVRRVRRVEEAEADPEMAAYRLRTRTRYDDDGTLVITIRASAQDGAVILAALEAKRARARPAAREGCGRRGGPGRSRGDGGRRTVGGDVRAGRAGRSRGNADGAVDPTPAPQDASLPYTREEFLAAWNNSPYRVHDLLLEGDTVDERDARLARTRGKQPVSDVSAETSAATQDARPMRATDGEALLAMAQAALDAERVAHPDVARRSRSRLTAHIDPLSGWARLPDGELLPPTSLSAVLKTLPGRGGVVRLRPLSAADLTRHDLGRSSRVPSQALRDLLGALDGAARPSRRLLVGRRIDRPGEPRPS
jgi:hypothetical protein